MTKKHSSVGKYLNPPFDPRMLHIGPPSLGSSKLQRGRLVMANANTVTGVKHGVHFLYNPVAVEVDHQISSQIVNGAFQQSAGDPQNGQMGQTVNIGGVSVDLLYDRTYELWDKSKAHTLAGRFGVYSDVLAFYLLLGVTGTSDGGITANSMTNANVAQFNISEIPNNNTVWQSLYPTGPITANTLVYLYIGDKMRFYGIVTAFSITYSHWSEKMIPMRCQVSLSVQFMVDPKTVNKRIKRKANAGVNH